MILALTLANSASYMTAATSGVETGYAEGSYGSLSRSPLSARTQGADLERLSHTTAVGGQISLYFEGDVTSWITGKSLYVAGNTYAVADASSSSYAAGPDQTQINWSEPSNPFTAGQDYLVRFE